jgi:hypothetical protein
MKLKTLTTFSLLLMAYLTPTQASDELKRLHRCYGLFTHDPISTSSTLWKQVESGTKSGTDACMEVLEKAVLGTNGEIKKVNGAYDPEGIKVLSSFLKFHYSQFEVPSYTAALSEESSNVRFMVDVTDMNEMAYHFLYSLFHPQQKFSDVVTRNFSLRGKRFSMKSARTKNVRDGAALVQFWEGMSHYGITSNIVEYNPPLTETGLLIGLVPDTLDIMLNPDLINTTVKANKFYEPYDFSLFKINRHLGAGVIGTQSYMIGNTGYNSWSNGGANHARRWSKNVFMDLMCRDLPVLRNSDVNSEVVIDSTFPWRHSNTCMACHSTIDPMVGVIRNTKAGWSSSGDNSTKTSTYRIKYFGLRNPDLAAAPHPHMTEDLSYYRRPPHGRILYRSYDGTLVNSNVQNLQELGARIADSNDFYACAAKRYYQFLTGIEVRLDDLGNINTQQPTPGEKHHRDQVINLGQQLKTHQSLRTLIRNIIQSPTFLRPGQGV